ncbi:RNA-directed DNA polymerase, eukaryota [Tanacetum coccineum]
MENSQSQQASTNASVSTSHARKIYTNEDVVRIRPTTRKGDVWSNYDMCIMIDGVEKARCKKCMKFYNPGSNSTLRTHKSGVHAVPIKINILAWKVCLDILPTRFNLSLRGLDIPSILCPICHLAGESSSHLFFSCNVARQLFQKIARWWELDLVDLFSYADWILWFSSLRLAKGIKSVLEGVFYVAWWALWKFRNEAIFGSAKPRLELIFDEVVLKSFSWVSTRCNGSFDWSIWLKCPITLTL